MNRNERVNKEMLTLERRSKKGDVFSAFKLYKYYENGIVERLDNGEIKQIIAADEDKANFYLGFVMILSLIILIATVKMDFILNVYF